MTAVIDEGHKTTKPGWIMVTFSQDNVGIDSVLRTGDSTWLIADDSPGNRIAIEAR